MKYYSVTLETALQFMHIYAVKTMHYEKERIAIEHSANFKKQNDGYDIRMHEGRRFIKFTDIVEISLNRIGGPMFSTLIKKITSTLNSENGTMVISTIGNAFKYWDCIEKAIIELDDRSFFLFPESHLLKENATEYEVWRLNFYGDPVILEMVLPSQTVCQIFFPDLQSELAKMQESQDKNSNIIRMLIGDSGERLNAPR